MKKYPVIVAIVCILVLAISMGLAYETYLTNKNLNRILFCSEEFHLSIKIQGNESAPFNIDVPSPYAFGLPRTDLMQQIDDYQPHSVSFDDNKMRFTARIEDGAHIDRERVNLSEVSDSRCNPHLTDINFSEVTELNQTSYLTIKYNGTIGNRLNIHYCFEYDLYPGPAVYTGDGGIVRKCINGDVVGGQSTMLPLQMSEW